MSGLLDVHIFTFFFNIPDRWTYTWVSLTGTLIPQIYVTYMGFTVNTFFIPIMGRAGTEDLPDLVVAVTTMAPIAMVIPFQVRYVHNTPRIFSWM